MKKETINEFEELLNVAERLMGPGGCPWDREQTLVTMRSALLEEACEAIEAIDCEDDQNLMEELGDLFYQIIFLSQIAQKEERFKLNQVILRVREKLIFRHPHVFGEGKVKDAQEVLKQWEEIKMREKSERESLLDGIPKILPALTRAYKVAGKMQREEYPSDIKREFIFRSEEELGDFLWQLAYSAKSEGLNPENALRKKLLEEEEKFRAWEALQKEQA